MVEMLPLDSPVWGQLSACFSPEKAIKLLRQIVATRELGEAWVGPEGLLEQLLHQGTVYGVSSAALPHLIELAPYVDEESRRDLWIGVGLLVTAGAGRFPSPPEPGLQAGLTAALDIAQSQAIRDFVADVSVVSEEEATLYALACVTLAGHRAGRAMSSYLSPGAPLGWGCPGCGTRCVLDGFADPFALPCAVPAFAATTEDCEAWRPAAEAIMQASRAQALGPGWDGFLSTARRVALAGVPEHATASAVWCLIAAMVATRSAAAPWARTLARLAGHVRCHGCDKVWAIADVLGMDDDGYKAAPVDITTAGPLSGDIWPEAIADAITGFLPSPRRTLAHADVSARVAWRVEGDPVDSVTVTAGRPAGDHRSRQLQGNPAPRPRHRGCQFHAPRASQRHGRDRCPGRRRHHRRVGRGWRPALVGRIERAPARQHGRQ